MKRILTIILLFSITLSAFSDTADSFWKWIAENELTIQQEYNTKKVTEKIYNELTKYSKGLAVIIPSFGAAQYEIVISSSAHPEMKKVMDNLFAKKPTLKQIKITKYLQPGMAYTNLQVFGTIVPFENIGVIADKIDNGYSLTILSGKFKDIPDGVIFNDFGLYAIYLMGEEKLMNKVINVNILRVSMVSPDVFSIIDLDKKLK